jgi:phage repressor protein C with HTH and peptisase S24 domain
LREHRTQSIFGEGLCHGQAVIVAHDPARADEHADSRKRLRRSAAGFSPVTEINVRASAGPGAFHEGLEEAKEIWLFPDAVIRHEFRARAEDLHIVTIDGDSMEPLLSSGDRIVVD